MSDISDNNFIVPYPPEDVYGLGIVGPAAPSKENTEENNEEVNKENNTEDVSNHSNQNNKQDTERINQENSKVNADNNSEFNIKNAEKEIDVQSKAGISNNVRLEDHLGKNIDTTV